MRVKIKKLLEFYNPSNSYFIVCYFNYLTEILAVLF